MNKLRIAFLYNRRSQYPKLVSDPLDIDAEWDDDDTINRVGEELIRCGFELVESDNPILLLDNDFRKNIDLVFNMCEMKGGIFREALVPGICELLNIPYVFSSPDVMVITLNKNLTNLLLAQAGIDVPTWYSINNKTDLQTLCLYDYPYIVKPQGEGSGKGIDDNSIVYDQDQMVRQINWILKNYEQPALVQQFISGPEFTVSVIESEKKIMPMAPIQIKSVILNDKTSWQNIPEKSQESIYFQLQNISEKVFRSLGCRDASRIDIRLSNTYKPFVLDVNPIPMLHPTIGYFSESIRQAGWSYKQALLNIVSNACDRYHLKV